MSGETPTAQAAPTTPPASSGSSDASSVAVVAAVRAGDVAQLDALLKRWKEVAPATGGNGSYQAMLNRALMWAGSSGHPPVVAYLLDAGAQPAEGIGHPMRTAAQAGHKDVLMVLVSRGIDVDVDDGVALYAAAQWGRLDCVEFLIEVGASVDIEDGAALRIACTHEHVDVIRALVAAGANPNIKDGLPLRAAAKAGKAQSVAALLALGADPQIIGKDWLTKRGVVTLASARQIALDRDHHDVVAMLDAFAARQQLTIATDAEGRLLPGGAPMLPAHTDSLTFTNERGAAVTTLEPWQMTKTQWEHERNAIRPEIAQSRFTKHSRSEAVSAMKRLEYLCFGVTAEASRTMKAAQRGEITLSADELERVTERLESNVTHEDVVRKAIRDGLPVPANVLGEYPDIQREVDADRHTRPLRAPDTDIDGRPASSWVVRNRETGEVLFETFDRKTVDALNTKKYVAVPIGQHLAELNEAIRAGKLGGTPGHTIISSENGARQTPKRTPRL